MSGIQETYSTLMEIDRLLGDIELKVQNLQQTVGGSDSGEAGGSSDGGGFGGVGGTGLSLRQNFRLINVSIASLQRFTGGGTLAQIGNKISETTTMIIRLYALINILEELTMAASLNPFLIGLAGVNALAFGMSVQNLGQ